MQHLYKLASMKKGEGRRRDRKEEETINTSKKKKQKKEKANNKQTTNLDAKPSLYILSINLQYRTIPMPW